MSVTSGQLREAVPAPRRDEMSGLARLSSRITGRSSRPGGTAGFTIVELIVSALIASVLMGAVYQVLVTNQRVSVVQSEQVAGHQTVRAGIDLLTQELREVSAAGGDLLVIEEDRVSFRALRAHGLVCVGGSVTTPVLRAAVMTRSFLAGESLYVFADLDPETAADDAWLETTIQDAEDEQTCGADNHPAQNLTVTGFDATHWTSIRQGAPLRSWEEIEYTVEAFSGELYLVRVAGGSVARLVGPLRDGDGLRFDYLDEDGDPAATPAEVRIVTLELRTASLATTESGEAIGDSLTTSVQLRN